MRVLFIGKRFYTNRDAFTERFGRIYQLPYWWAQAGHDVDLWLIDYHGRDADQARDKALTVEATPVLRRRFFARWMSAIFSRWSKHRPDIIVASGDCYTGLVAYFAALLCGARFVFDVYDRYDVFEGYRRLPGFDPLSFLLRRSWVASFASAKVLDDLAPLTDRALLVPNGVDLDRFRPRPARESRQELGLPDGIPRVGYFGSMEPERGITDLIDAVALLRKRGVEIELLIGGQAHPDVDLDRPGVRYLGNIPFEKMPAALASCDLLALPYRQGAFVDNASSCKIAEYIAMERPIVSTRTPNLVQNFPEQAAQLDGLLATPGDVGDLAASLEAQLKARRLVDMPKGMSWQEISDTVLAAFEDGVAGEAAR
jgi:glycosyltransferase involved in cell wall biosynthesis